MADKQQPDLSKMPNFQAALDWIKEKERAGHNFGPIKKWMELLEEWCQAGMDKLQEHETEENEEIEQLKYKLEDAEINALAFEGVTELLEDVKRGVADMKEVYEACGLRAP